MSQITWDASAPFVLTPHPVFKDTECCTKFTNNSTPVLHVSSEGEFQWHPDADRLIETCADEALKAVLIKLKYGRRDALLEAADLVEDYGEQASLMLAKMAEGK